MNLNRILLSFLFVAASLGQSFAQNWEVSGNVTSEKDGTPMVGVTVLAGRGGSVTDLDGYYKVKAQQSDTLRISFIGYEEQLIPIGAKNVINVKMVESVQNLDEVVVIGYGEQRKREITGAIASIKSDELNKFASSNFSDALQGQLAGVNVQASSGAPGGKSNIQIRGIGSFSAEAIEPLYVVDGFPYTSAPDINSNEIESIEVLKDAASASIYGSRASNGVILITTKRAQAGKLKIDYNGYYGIQKITSGVPLTNTEQYLYVYKMREILNEPEGGQLANPLDKNNDGLNKDTDWMEYLTNDNAPIQSHSITLSGGDDNLKNSTMLNFLSQDGVVIKSKYTSFTGRSNTSFKRGNFTAFTSIGLTYSNKENAPWNLHSSAINLSPMLEPINYKSSSLVASTETNGVGAMSSALKEENTGLTRGYSINANMGYNILPGLNVSVNAGANVSDYKGRVYNPQFYIYDEEGNLTSSGTQLSTLTENRSYSQRWNTEFLLKYSKKFRGVHKVDFLAGYSMDGYNYESRRSVKTGFPSGGDITVPDAGTGGDQFTGNDTNTTMMGIIGRVMYNYKDKYMMSASVRRDGSSKFNAEKWATFPSVSGGWSISREPFFRNLQGNKKRISDLKLRASIGTAGNQNIKAYQYDTYVINNLNYVLGQEGSDNLWLGTSQRGFSNPDVKWETSLSRNIGVDLSMWKGRFTLNADYYYVNKSDMLLPVTLAPSSGADIGNWAYSTIYLNAGDMYNKGLELAASYKGNIKKLRYNVSATYTKNTNMVTETYTAESNLAGGGPLTSSSSEDNTTYIREGYAAGSFFLVQNGGTVKTAEQLAAYKEIVPTAQLGDLMLIDANHDGQINDKDRVYCGKGSADWEGGLNVRLWYHNFDFSLQLYGSVGNMVYNGAKLQAYMSMRHLDQYYAWSPSNPTSNIPAVRKEAGHNNLRAFNDYYLEDGSYLRVRNIQLGYTIPRAVLNKLNLRNVRVYFSAQNPFTLTGYTGYDPECGGDGLFTKGVDMSNYPVSSQYRLGLQLGF